MTHGGVCAEKPHPAFLLWIQAVKSNWGVVLNAPLTLDGYIAGLMLQQCETFETKMHEQQVRAMAQRGG